MQMFEWNVLFLNLEKRSIKVQHFVFCVLPANQSPVGEGFKTFR